MTLLLQLPPEGSLRLADGTAQDVRRMVWQGQEQSVRFELRATERKACGVPRLCCVWTTMRFLSRPQKCKRSIRFPHKYVRVLE